MNDVGGKLILMGQGVRERAQRRARNTKAMADMIIRLDCRWRDQHGAAYDAITLNAMEWETLVRLAMGSGQGREGREHE